MGMLKPVNWYILGAFVDLVWCCTTGSIECHVLCSRKLVRVVGGGVVVVVVEVVGVVGAGGGCWWCCW